jgi:hypothetical protein
MWRRTPWVFFPLAIAGCGATTTAAGTDSGAGADVTAAPADAALQADAGVAEGRPGCPAVAAAAVRLDAAACFIDLAQYDRSCATDSDCVSSVELPCAVWPNSLPVQPVYVHGGDFCDGCNCSTGATIGRSAVAQYVADLSMTPQGSGQVAFPPCSCPPAPPPPVGPQCVDGSCRLQGE